MARGLMKPPPISITTCYLGLVLLAGIGGVVADIDGAGIDAAIRDEVNYQFLAMIRLYRRYLYCIINKNHLSFLAINILTIQC